MGSGAHHLPGLPASERCQLLRHPLWQRASQDSTRQPGQGWAFKPRKIALTGLNKCEKIRHKHLLWEDFPSGLCLTGNLPLPEKSRSAKTSPDTQHFLQDVHNLLSQLWPRCYQRFCARWKQGGWFITEHAQPSIRGAGHLRFSFINLWEQYLYIKTTLISCFYTPHFVVNKKKNRKEFWPT